jgi:hypothetical protein
LRVCGLAEAHPVALALLIVLAVEGGESRAPGVLGKALAEVGVKSRLQDWAWAPSAGRMQPMVRVQTTFLLRNSTRLRGR